MSRLPILPGAPRPLIFAHRGLSSRAPENTMASFRLAAEEGAPGIELDVRLTRDGKLAVIHDQYTGRVTAGRDPSAKGLNVEASAWAQLAPLDVGAWKDPRWAGERIPLLEDVLDEFGETVYFDIELKSPRATSRGLEAAVARAIRGARAGRGPALGCIVSSFNPIALARFKAIAPDIPTAIIWSTDRELPPCLRHGEGRWIAKADCLKPESSLHRGKAAENWRRRHWTRIAWTVDSPEEARELYAAGCDGFISNRADELLELLPGRRGASFLIKHDEQGGGKTP